MTFTWVKNKDMTTSCDGHGCLVHLGRRTVPKSRFPRPSSYPLLGPKYLLFGTIYPQLRVQGGSWLLEASNYLHCADPGV